MAFETVSVDRTAFEKLVQATIINGDHGDAIAAIEEMILVQGHTVVGDIILRARKKAHGIADVERDGEKYPAVGLRVGSTLHKPLPA